MRILKPTLLDLIELASRAREDEREQYEAIIGEQWDPERVASDAYNRIGLKFGVYDYEGRIIVAGGWDPIFDGVWQSWMIGSDDAWLKHWRTITKAARKSMDMLFRSEGARRLQTNAIASRVAACEWYERGLKMTREGTMRGFGLNGEDLAIYARLKENGDGR